METRNVLNPRVCVRRGFTLPTGDFASERVDVSCEVDVASGVTLADSMTGLDAICEGYLAEKRKKLQSQTKTPIGQPSASTARSTTPPSPPANDEAILRELATREYHSYKSGKPGEWCVSDQLSKPLFELLSKGPVEFEGWKYRLSGPKEDPSRFIARNRIGR